MNREPIGITNWLQSYHAGTTHWVARTLTISGAGRVLDRKEGNRNRAICAPVAEFAEGYDRHSREWRLSPRGSPVSQPSHSRDGDLAASRTPVVGRTSHRESMRGGARGPPRSRVHETPSRKRTASGANMRVCRMAPSWEEGLTRVT